MFEIKKNYKYNIPLKADKLNMVNHLPLLSMADPPYGASNNNKASIQMLIIIASSKLTTIS